MARVPKEQRYQTWAEIALGFWMGLSMLSMLYKNDFASMTTLALGAFAMTCPKLIKRQTFRGIVVLMIAAFVWDLIYMLFLHDSAAEDAQDSQ